MTRKYQMCGKFYKVTEHQEELSKGDKVMKGERPEEAEGTVSEGTDILANKATPPNNCQVMPFPNDQSFRSMSLWGHSYSNHHSCVEKTNHSRYELLLAF